MASRDFSEPHRSNYFSDFLNKGFILPAILIATIIASLLCMFFYYDFNAQLISNNSQIALIFFLVFYVLLAFVYLAFCIKKQNVGFNDSLSIGFFFTGIIFLIYLLAISKELLSLKTILVALAFIIVGIVFTLIRTTEYDYYEDREEFIGNRLENYIYQIFTKYNFVLTLIFSVLFNCFFYLVFKTKNLSVELTENNFSSYFDMIWSTAKDNPVLLSLFIVAIVLLAIFTILTIFKYGINPIDLVIASFIVNVPVMLAFAILTGNVATNILIAIGLIVLFVVLFGLRLLLYNKKEPFNPKTYWANIFKNKKAFGTVGISILIVAFSNTVTKCFELYSLSFNKTNGSISLVPLMIICSFCLLGFVYMGICLLKDIQHLTNTTISIYDSSFLPNIAFTIFNILTMVLVFKFEVLKLVILLSYLLVIIGIMFARKKRTK